MKCTNCGAELREGVVFCASCGLRMSATTVEDRKKDKKKKKIKPKKQKEPIGCLGLLIEICLIIILLVGGVILFSKGTKWYKIHKYNEFIGETIFFNENKGVKLTGDQKNEDWNSDGILNSEARDLNLNIAVIDSDGDGLSDYDEINVYKSNPLKYSTMGDIYSDGYKVKHDYDINVKYETYKAVYTDNKFLQLEANDPYDLNAYYKEYDGVIPSGYYLAHKPFRVFSFDGEANLEIINPNNLEVIKYDTIKRKSQKIKSRVENEYLVFEITDDNPILIVYKDDTFKNENTEFINSKNDNYLNEQVKEYYVLSYPLYNGPLYIKEVDNLKANGKSDQELVSYLNSKYDNISGFKHSYINTMTADLLDKILGNLVGRVSTDYNEDKYLINSFVVYGHCFGIEELETLIESKNKKVSKDLFNKKYLNKNCAYCADSGFDLNKNAFSFKNPKTTESNNLSSSMAFVTTNVYNNPVFPCIIDNEYNMSNRCNNGVWNKDLYNIELGSKLKLYADKDPLNNKKLDSSKVDQIDGNLINMLEYYLVDLSEKYPKQVINWEWNKIREKQTFISEETVNKLVEKIRNGKIVTANLLNADKYHVVNVYKIVEDSYDSDILYLKVYDSNLFNDMFWDKDTNYSKYDVTITLKRVYENTLSETKVKYVYDYNPINNLNYHYSSFNGGLDGLFFTDYDDSVL